MTTPKRTHKGLMFGIVPVFLDMSNPQCPVVEGRNFLCEILLDIVEPLFGFCIYLRTSIDDSGYEPAFPVRITGQLEEITL